VLVSPAEQVLVTAAVPDDIPGALAGARIDVVDGKVLPGVS
jgi:DNA replication and repair protein RecF